MASKAPPDVLAAGVVVFRPGKQVLLIHRPRYDDWSFPKGKLDPGEHLASAAVREAWEETGLHVQLGPPVQAQRYSIAGGRTKAVSYWTARVVGDDDVATYSPNEEVDQVRWVDAEKARAMLSYPHDGDTLDEALALRRKTQPLIVLRHGQARSRKAWRGDDRARTLLTRGHLQAQRLVTLLSAYAVSRVVSSSAVRCVETVQPYVDTTGWALKATKMLTEEDSSPARLRKVIAAADAAAARADRGTVLCSHRPVLPLIFAELGVDDPKLAPGEMLVLHRREGAVVATEHLAPL